MRSLRLIVAAFLLLALPPSQAAAQATGQDHIDHRHQTIRIQGGSLHPQLQRVSAKDAITWLNYSGGAVRISFDVAVAKKMVCTAVGGFHVSGSRLESPKIESRQFVSACRLQPGEYLYQVELYDESGGEGQASKARLQGKLVVE